MRLHLKSWHSVALVATAAAVAVGWLAWICRHDPGIHFLPGDSRADWIVFPRPVHSASHKIVNLDTAFRREFSLPQIPDRVELRVRAARRMDVSINNAAVPLPDIGNWKNEAAVDVASFLRAGTNTLEVRVFNDSAPAALCLSLSGKDLNLRSDSSWQSSITGSSWRSSALASSVRLPGPGNPIAGGENLRQALGQSWPTQLFLLALSIALCAFGFWWRETLAKRNADIPVVLLAVLTAALWLALFINNAILLPFPTGFDSDEHLKYIQFIQEHGRLPWPGDGYEMFQAPLFYLFSAVTLGVFRLSPSDTAGIILLRGLTTLFGVAQFVFIFLSVRLLFPRRPGLQLAGLLLAAFLPMQLYLAHYVTNETLAATLGSASLYLALRLARYPRGSTVQYALFGLIAGAALLTKATALLLIPPLFLMLGAKLWSGQEPAGASICKFLVATVVMLLVGGWYYVRLWTRFGSPLVGNWDAASGFSWWQDPGYHVAADYGRFGQSLVAPFFSSLNGFLDGIYSTLWGDGLAGGAADIAHRIPWNSAIMVCGYLWAMLPTILILGGAAVAVRRFVRTPSLEYFLLLTTAAAVCFGVVLMTLKVACFGQVKAFYGLSAVIPVCVFGAIGWDVMTRGRRRLQFVFAVLLVAFAINSFASVWILPTPQRHLFAARRFQIIHQSDAALRQVEQAVASDPSRSEAHALLSSVLEEMNHPEQAFREAELAVELGPREVGAHLRLGFVQADRGNLEAALAEARAALALGPENPVAYDLLLFCLSRLPEVDEEMLSTTRDALTVSPFNPFLHQALGLACARRSDFGGALSQFAYAAVISPNWHDPRMQFQTVLSNLGVDAQATRHLEEAAAIAHDSPLLLNDLAWLRATSPEAALRDGGQAVAMAERACRLTNRENANLLVTLAASYAEAGRFADAINIADQALQLAGQTHEDATGERAANLVAEFRANHPYREKAASIYH